MFIRFKRRQMQHQHSITLKFNFIVIRSDITGEKIHCKETRKQYRSLHVF